MRSLPICRSWVCRVMAASGINLTGGAKYANNGIMSTDETQEEGDEPAKPLKGFGGAAVLEIVEDHRGERTTNEKNK